VPAEHLARQELLVVHGAPMDPAHTGPVGGRDGGWRGRLTELGYLWRDGGDWDGGLLTIIKYIYLSLTYLHFIQYIEDKCLLLTGFTSFVDLSFQKHRIMKKHHMDKNSYMSLLCPKLRIVSDNMIQRDDVAKNSGPTDPR
jgi:hypothetical protein